MADSHYADTVFMLSCEGADASTSFADISTGGLPVTAVGNAQISSAVSKWGFGSAKFDGTGDRLEIPSVPALDLAASDFTIEMWINPLSAWNSGSAQKALISKWGASAFSFLLDYYAGAPRFIVPVSSTNPSGPTIVTAPANFDAGIWRHLAAVRAGAQFLLWLDGALLASTAAISVPTSVTPLWIAHKADGGSAAFADTYTQGIRITRAARYTAPFTPGPIVKTLSGDVKDSTGAYVNRTVRAFVRSTGRLVGETISDAATGSFTLRVPDMPIDLDILAPDGSGLPDLHEYDVIPV